MALIATFSVVFSFLLYIVIIASLPGIPIEWYPWRPLEKSSGLSEKISHHGGFSTIVDNNWASHLVVTESPPSLRIEVTCFGYPTGISFFTVTMLDQKPDVSGMKEATFQNELAQETTNPRGGRWATCLEYSLVFQRKDKWFRVDYWFPNGKGNSVYHNALPANMREFIETFAYEPTK